MPGIMRAASATLLSLALAALSCGPTSRRSCEEDCRLAPDVGACVDTCRRDGGDHGADDDCAPDLESCPAADEE